jgi:hypothetical protein
LGGRRNALLPQSIDICAFCTQFRMLRYRGSAQEST